MADDKDDWDVRVIQLKPDEGGRLPWPDPSPREPEFELSDEQFEKFDNRCYFCFWRSWDVFESGMPMWSTCKRPGHQQWHTRTGGGWGIEYKYIECSTVAKKYEGERCPRFFPVILRLPFRLAWRGARYALYRYFERKYRKAEERKRA